MLIIFAFYCYYDNYDSCDSYDYVISIFKPISMLKPQSADCIPIVTLFVILNSLNINPY